MFHRAALALKLTAVVSLAQILCAGDGGVGRRTFAVSSRRVPRRPS
jgi:hypothetical protein